MCGVVGGRRGLPSAEMLAGIVSLVEALGVDCQAFLDEPAARPETGRGPHTKTPGEAGKSA